jgi:hypothetical protein
MTPMVEILEDPPIPHTIAPSSLELHDQCVQGDRSLYASRL